MKKEWLDKLRQRHLNLGSYPKTMKPLDGLRAHEDRGMLLGLLEHLTSSGITASLIAAPTDSASLLGISPAWLIDFTADRSQKVDFENAPYLCLCELQGDDGDRLFPQATWRCCICEEDSPRSALWCRNDPCEHTRGVTRSGVLARTTEAYGATWW